MVEMDVNTALASIGFGCGQVVVLMVCMLLSVYTVTEAYIIGYLLVLTSCEFSTSPAEKTLLANAALAGMVSSGLFLGALADRYGRKYTIRLALIITLCCSFLASLMPEVYSMSVSRFFVGIFLNALASLPIGYLMEFYPPKWRPLAVSIQCQGVAIGLIYNPSMGWALLPTNYSWRISSSIEFRTWRFFMWVVTIPGWLGLLGLSFLPESPYFLMLAQRDEEATKALKWMCRLNRKKWDELNITLVDPSPGQEKVSIWKQIFTGLAKLFKRPVVRNFLISVFFIFGIFLDSIGMGIWYPAIRNTDNRGYHTFCQIIESHPVFQKNPKTTESPANRTEDEPPFCQDQMHNFLDPIFYALSYSMFFVVSTVLLLCLTRRYVLAIHVGSACLLGIGLNFIKQPVGVLITFTLVLVVPGVLIGLATSALADCVPVELRGTALCMVRSLSRLGAVVGSTLVGLLMKVSCTATLNIFVAYLAVCVGLALSLPRGI